MESSYFEGCASSIEEVPLDTKCYEMKLKQKLTFFFMNPVEKWNTRRKFPFKFMVQIIKIMLVTFQLCLFAHNRYNHVNYASDNRISFSHLFLNGWDSTREVFSYPPGVGPLAIYKQNEFYETIDYAIEGYKNISNSIGPYSYADDNNEIVPPVLVFNQYRSGVIFGFNESYVFNNEVDTIHCNLSLEHSAMTSIRKCLNGKEILFSAFISAELKFSLKTVNFKAAGPLSQPDCYQFNIAISFDNEGMDGQVTLLLNAEPIRLQCQGDVKYISDNNLDYVLRSILNLLVISICLVSFILCIRAIIRAQQLKYETINYFQQFRKQDLSLEGRWEFWNLWYIMIVVNDVLIIVGSCIKEEIERKQFVGDQWNTCSVCLGTGNLLVWFGVLRYLGFFKTYNVVMLTMKKAFPKVLRFLFCALIIYAGFTFCGWLVLGPYHTKFRTLAGTSECLFSLINGDDMYATFSIMPNKSPLLWWYSRIYLYIFISLYIYVVLSLFISIIMDAYETIKLYYKNGFPKNDLQLFIMDRSNELFIPNDKYPHDESSSMKTLLENLCCVKM